MKIEESNQISFRKKWKLILVFVSFSICIFIILIKLFIIQFIEAEEYRKIARNQHESRIFLRPERGNIYDREGKILATNIISYSFAVDPTVLKDLETIKYIASLVDSTQGEIYQKLLKKITTTKKSFVWLVRGLDDSSSSKFTNLKIEGLIKIIEPKRTYVYNEIAAQLLGCTDVDSRGVAGLELSLDSLLKGTPGYMTVLRDAIGRLRPIANLPVESAKHGCSIELTIDIELQKIMETELINGATKTGSSGAVAIAIVPETGEILAMSSYPSVNPNTSINNSADLRNKAITDIYEPGSTFKIVTAAAAIEEGLITPESIVNGYNGLLVNNDIKIADTHPFDKTTFSEAFRYSSNIVFANLASSIPDAKFYKYIRDFGFGHNLDFDSYGESEGLIKKMNEFNSISKKFAGFGYGISVTPLQLLISYSTIANSGIMMKPYVIKSIRNNSGDLIYEGKPQKIRQVVSKKTSDILKDLLVGVVENGTGKYAQISGLSIAGKTGTSQQFIEGAYSKTDYTASFVGFFPAESPKIAILILLDKPTGNYYGGATAAPIFKNIVKGWLTLRPDLLTGLNNKSDITQN
jgi:cell division protein FtsI (penicillin-binding protein 3)